MTETREIRLEVTESEVTLLCKVLDFTAREKPARNVELGDLEAKIDLAWIEAKFRDEDDAHNDWVKREMYGEEVTPDPDAVVRCIEGRNVVVRR